MKLSLLILVFLPGMLYLNECCIVYLYRNIYFSMFFFPQKRKKKTKMLTCTVFSFSLSVSLPHRFSRFPLQKFLFLDDNRELEIRGKMNSDVILIAMWFLLRCNYFCWTKTITLSSLEGIMSYFSHSSVLIHFFNSYNTKQLSQISINKITMIIMKDYIKY